MIEITKFEFINKGTLVAKFDIKIPKWGGFIIRECTYFESGDKKWINLPGRQYEAEGKKKYYTFNLFEDRKLEEKFKEAIIKGLETHIALRTSKIPAEQSLNDQVPF